MTRVFGAALLWALACAAAPVPLNDVSHLEAKIGFLEQTVERQASTITSHEGTISTLLSATLELNRNLQLLEEGLRSLRADSKEDTRSLLEEHRGLLMEGLEHRSGNNGGGTTTAEKADPKNHNGAAEAKPSVGRRAGRGLLSSDDTTWTTSVSRTLVETPQLCAASIETWALSINGTNLINFLNVEFEDMKRMLYLLVGSLTKVPTTPPTTSPTSFPSLYPTALPIPQPTLQPTLQPTIQFFVSSSGNYAECQSICAGFGATLACPKNSAEDSTMNSMCPSSCYYGVNDISSEGSWVCNGKGIPYSNWNTGEPNNSGGEDCVQNNPDGSWNDLNCAAVMACLCENVDN